MNVQDSNRITAYVEHQLLQVVKLDPNQNVRYHAFKALMETVYSNIVDTSNSNDIVTGDTQAQPNEESNRSVIDRDDVIELLMSKSRDKDKRIRAESYMYLGQMMSSYLMAAEQQHPHGKQQQQQQGSIWTGFYRLIFRGCNDTDLKVRRATFDMLRRMFNNCSGSEKPSQLLHRMNFFLNESQHLSDEHSEEHETFQTMILRVLQDNIEHIFDREVSNEP